MNPKPGFSLHPGAAQNITEIWEFIAEDSPLAARRIREQMLEAIGKLARFRIKVTSGRISLRGRCVFRRCENT